MPDRTLYGGRDLGLLDVGWPRVRFRPRNSRALARAARGVLVLSVVTAAAGVGLIASGVSSGDPGLSSGPSSAGAPAGANVILGTTGSAHGPTSVLGLTLAAGSTTPSGPGTSGGSSSSGDPADTPATVKPAVLDSGACPAPAPYATSPAQTILDQVDACLAQQLGQLSLVRQEPTATNPATANLDAVSALDNAHIWAVGASCTLLFTSDAGVHWVKDTHVPGGCTSILTGVSVQDPGHGWVVGANGTVLVCTANCNQSTATWGALSGAGVNGSLNFSGVWGQGNTVYAVGTLGGAGQIWACTANCNLVTAGPGPGKATWANVTPTNLGTIAPLAAVSDPGGGVIVVGSSSTVLLCTGPTCKATSWSRLHGSSAPTGVNLTAVWTSGANAALAVGPGAIWGCSANCSSSTAVWAQVAAGAASLTGVGSAGGPNGPAWATGTGGVILYCTASCENSSGVWAAESTPAVPAATDLEAISVSDPNHSWVVGPGGSIYGLANPPSDTTNHVSQAVADLAGALNPALWAGADGNHLVSPQGNQVFANIQDAIQDLMGIKRPQPAWVGPAISALDSAARLLATTAISDNACIPKKPQELTVANSELAAGDTATGQGHADAAVGHYQNAWTHANNAQGRPCAGITVSPSGAPQMTASNMVPGDTVGSGSISVTVTGSAASEVALYEQNLTGALVPGLTLQLVEDGATTLYNGPLNSSWTNSSPLVLPGTGGNTWALNEHHTFVFMVTFTKSSGNTYQHTNASVNFVWARS